MLHRDRSKRSKRRSLCCGPSHPRPRNVRRHRARRSGVGVVLYRVMLDAGSLPGTRAAWVDRRGFLFLGPMTTDVQTDESSPRFASDAASRNALIRGIRPAARRLRLAMVAAFSPRSGRIVERGWRSAVSNTGRAGSSGRRVPPRDADGRAFREAASVAAAAVDPLDDGSTMPRPPEPRAGARSIERAASAVARVGLNVNGRMHRVESSRARRWPIRSGRPAG